MDFIDDGEAEYDSNSDGLSSLSARCVYAPVLRVSVPLQICDLNKQSFPTTLHSGDESADEDHEARRRRRKARRAAREQGALIHRRVLNADLEESPGLPMIPGQSDMGARLPFIQSVRGRDVLVVSVVL